MIRRSHPVATSDESMRIPTKLALTVRMSSPASTLSTCGLSEEIPVATDHPKKLAGWECTCSAPLFHLLAPTSLTSTSVEDNSGRNADILARAQNTRANKPDTWDANFWCADIPELVGNSSGSFDWSKPGKSPLAAFLDGECDKVDIVFASRHLDTEDLSEFSHSSSDEIVHKKQPTRSVRFSDISIRTYEVVPGDNPGCSDGPSLSLGWKYEEGEKEHIRSKEKDAHKTYKPLSKKSRSKLLRKCGFSEKEIAESVRNTSKIRNQRFQTLNNLGNEKMEETVENVKRGFQKIFQRQPGH